MSSLDPSLTPAAVVHAFARDAPNLFLGAAFCTIGFIAIAFAALRRQRDLLLLYFGLLAALYGLRLWLQAALPGLLAADSHAYPRIVVAINYFVPIPFVLYIRAAKILLTRLSQFAGYLLAGVDGLLGLATLAFGPRPLYATLNTSLVILALAVFLIELYRAPQHPGPDRVLIRRGIVVFVVFALWDNAVRLFLPVRSIEVFGFAIFLACLGFVAARRTVARDRALNEIQKELEIARHIQRSILPADFPSSPHFAVAARYAPMTTVAGDLYDFVVADHARAGLLIADVSGHGVPAALIASMVKLAAAGQRAAASDPAGFLHGMNAALCRNTQNQFVTAAYAYIEASSAQLRYAAAGHPPMLLLRGGEVLPVQENGLLLAAFDFAAYTTSTRALHPGDRLLLYTDGLLEAPNAAGEFFGPDRLAHALRDTARHAVAPAADAILALVQSWSVQQEDDLTLVLCDFQPAS